MEKAHTTSMIAGSMCLFKDVEFSLHVTGTTPVNAMQS